MIRPNTYNDNLGKRPCLKDMPAMMHAINPSGEIIDVSDIWLEKMGYEREEVINKSFFDFLMCESFEITSQKYFPEFFENGFYRDVPYQFIKKTGEIFEGLLSASSTLDADGKFLYSCAIIVDACKPNTLEQVLLFNEPRYRATKKEMLNGFALHEVICDEAGQPVDYRFLEINSAFEKITGLKAEIIVGKTILEVLPKTETFWVETFGQVAIGRQPIHFEQYSAELHRYYSVFAFSPAARQFAVLISDISARKRDEVAIRHSEELFRRTFDLSPIGAAIVGLDYRFKKVNQQLCKITGYQEQHLLDLGFPDITFKDDLPIALKQAEELALGLIDQYEIDKRYIKRDGTPVWGRLSVRMIRSDNGNPLYYLPMIVDIDNLKKLEMEKDFQLELLNLTTKDSDLKTMVEDVLSFLKTWCGVDAVAIRLQKGKDYPYFKTLGFPEEFIQRENSLFSIKYPKRQFEMERNEPLLECMCGCVIRDLTDSSLPFFTTGGSFYTNSTSKLLSQSDTFQMPYGIRKHCNEAGYESILLIPMRVGENTIGMIQINNKKEDCFSLDFVSFMERLVGHISVAVMQRLREEQLNAKQNELEESNAALKVILRNREQELYEHDQAIMLNIRQLVLPYIEQIKLGSLDIRQESQLKIVKNNLQTLTSPFVKKMAAVNIGLTPSLIQVADMIRNGLTNKEIAKQKGISVKSVETYRKRIRARLNLQNSKINLRVHLMNMGHWDK